MNGRELTETAKALVAGNKGLLAMDESNPTCNKRFAKLGIPQTEAARRDYRELIVTTPDLRDTSYEKHFHNTMTTSGRAISNSFTI